VGSNGTYNSNRLGFKGVEDLGGGLNARFNLETGFNTGTGAVESTTGSFGSTTPSAFTGTGSFWNRTATVGLGGAWGGIDIGHQYSVSFKTIGLYDPFNYKYTGIIPLASISAGNAPASALGGTRFNNDIQYTGTFGAFTARAEYSFGEIAGANTTNRAYAGGVSYANGPLAIGLALTRKDIASTAGFTSGAAATATTAGAAAATAASPKFKDQAWTLGGAYKFGPARVALGYNDEKLSGAAGAGTGAGALTGLTGAALATAGQLLIGTGTDTRVRTGWAGLGWDLTPAVNVTGAWYQTRVTGLATPTLSADGRANLYILGATYAFSKRTNAYLEGDYTTFSGRSIVGAGAATTQDRVTGVSVGINHLF